MANTILSVTEYANRAVDYLSRKKSLLSTLDLGYVDETMAMNKGETANVAKPPSFTVAAYNGATLGSMQDINQGTVAVTLDTDVIVPVELSLREAGKSANDVEATIVAPAMDAFTKSFDASILTAFAAGDTLTAIPEAAQSIAQMELGLVALNDADCPMTDLHYAVANSDASTLRQLQALYSQDINSANNNRSAGDVVGAYGGIDIFGTNAISAAGATTSNWMYDSKFATVAMRPLNTLAVAGAEVGVATYGGMAITVTKQWNSATQASILVFRALYGCKVLDGNRGINIISDGLGD
jgi:hypothetical protein